MTATIERKPKTRKMKFRLLHGLHIVGRQQDSTKLTVAQQQLEEGVITEAQFKEQTKNLHPRRVYHPGEMIESTTDLLRLNGPHPMVPKFARADDDVAAMVPVPYQTPDTTAEAPPADDVFSDMTLAELKRMAKSEGIDISGLATTEAIAQRIRQAAKDLDS